MDNACTVPGCTKPSKTKKAGLCGAHDFRLRKHGSPTGGGPNRYRSPDGICTVEGCGRPHCASGLCSSHYAKRARHGDSMQAPPRQERCSIDGCGRPHRAQGYCTMHYQRNRYSGDPLKTAAQARREANDGKLVKRYRWVGVGAKKVNGAWRTVTRLEHRVVMERKLGRPLRDDENVHHLNGDRMDNRPENLELWVRTQPAGQRVADLLAWAREIVARYGGEVDAHLPRPPTHRGGD